MGLGIRIRVMPKCLQGGEGEGLTNEQRCLDVNLARSRRRPDTPLVKRPCLSRM